MTGTLIVKGTMEWQMKDSFTNPSQFHSAVPYTAEIESSITTSRTLVESIVREESNSKSHSISLNVNLPIEIFNMSLNTAVVWTSSVVNTSVQETSEKDAETKTTTTTERIGPVGVDPGEALYIFEKKVKFPTVSWDTGDLKVWPSADIPPLNEEVFMKIPVHMAPRKYLKDIKVRTYGVMAYSNNFISYKDGLSGESKNVKTENWGDINRGYGGQYVFLEPVWTADISQGADNIEVKLSDSFPTWAKDRGQEDMAKGAGGAYRLLDIWHCKDVKEKIVEVVLWGGQLHRVPDGWTGMTGDLNKGRKGRYLYIVWKTASE